jgi:hypothetical protein
MKEQVIPGNATIPLPETNAADPDQWRALYLQVAAERDRLRQDVDLLRKERDDLLNAVYALLPPEEMQISKAVLRAHHGAEPTVDQLLAEIKEASRVA